MFNPVSVGRRTRYSYARIKEVMEMPHLLDIQRESYRWFLEVGLAEIFRDISPIQDFSGNLILSFESFALGEPKYDLDECKERDVTYAAPLRVNVRLVNRETGEIKEQEVFMGDFPLMTDTGTFIINGAERVIVSQLVRSPGTYYGVEIDTTGKELYNATMIPNRGAWIELETDANDIVSVRIDRTRKMPVTYLIRALGYETDAEIRALFGDDPRMLATIERDTDEVKTRSRAVIEIYRRLRPGEPANEDNARQLLETLFFDPRRYDLATVGRYKLTKKLGWRRRLLGKVLAEPVVDVETGEIVFPKGEPITPAMVDAVSEERETALFGDGELIAFQVQKPDGDIYRMLCAPTRDYQYRTVTREDIMAAISYLLGLMDSFGNTDDIDHLGNRRVRAVGELLQNQFRIGLSRMERVVRERMSIQETESITPQGLINIRPVVAAVKEFFGSSQLSQFMDQHNPLSELTHKRRLSALGPGGLSRERAGFEVRDVHNSHYGRMCPVESPEGPNIGLIGSLANYARVNRFGFMETPYRRVDKEHHRVTEDVRYLTADEEDDLIIAQANEPLDANEYFVNERVTARFHEETGLHPRERVDYMDVSPRQVFSIATAMIPFLENDDANRALMGANMQRQAVPLLRTQAPLVGTGMEYKAACDSGVMVLAKHAGEVTDVTADAITVRSDEGAFDTYKLQKFIRSNQATCINQKPLVYAGDRVTEGQPIADGPSTDNGELALGYNIIVAYMPWEGYNYEDAILLSENLVKRDLYTSIHIEEYECDARDTKLGPEEITRDIPNVAEEALKDLDEDGIISIGADVRPGDILVGKVTPKGETELTAEERLLRAIFGEKAREVRDTSLRVPHGEAGKIIDVKIFTRENNDELPPGVNRLVRVYIAQKRKISVGDKMSGRHGNKGVVSRIMRQEDMPFLPDGTPVDIVLNPLGVPSRMNIGQVLETHLGMACRVLGQRIKDGDPTVEGDLRAAGYDFDKNGMPVPDVAGIHIATPVFDGAGDDDVFGTIRAARLPSDGKTVLYDGRTGEPFENRVTVGCVYMLKLHHLVDDKIHARSTGPYSLVTQQPLGGKAQFGGQRFGEMEVWALEAYGAAYTLQEILTVKSDDVVGRVKAYESIVKGDNIPEPGVPESFKVLIKELQAIGLDIKVLNEDAKEIAIRDEEDEDINEKARSLDLDVEGVDENGAAPPPADDYEENVEAEESADEDLIADLGTDEDLAADDMDAILHGGLDDIDNPHEDDL
ncbi:DNA-directed RNA polymerase subunit beta [Selenomonas sp. oral taxon 478]|uniref:DNA-directed RNA polymerase subunit beta n=1 Tax=Selenomonas sp. oral taxon 478 TaxID=712538 RepID=UPI00067A146C|nr:DNA-directed RNA polymerase subunit beta [Selenomonas sp. oral taxon 478]AKT53528.1 DNA-directed RNA polymerase subunit beta [Selenomonas sp. oral taxon 478]